MQAVYEYTCKIYGSAGSYYVLVTPNGFSEFTFSAQSSTVASFSSNGVKHCYTSFAQAVADALATNVSGIYMPRTGKSKPR